MATYAGYEARLAGIPEFEVAGRWRRFFAFFVDQVVFAILTVVILIVMALTLVNDVGGTLVTHADGSVGLTAHGEAEIERALRLLSFTILGMVAFYYIFFTALSGKTPGKGICGIRVIEVQAGGVPTLVASVLRYGVYAGGSIISVSAGAMGAELGMWEFAIAIAWLGIVGWIFIDPAARGIHDLAAQTVVVRDAPPSRDAYAGPAHWAR